MNRKGITLIALLVTVIVLITISSVSFLIITEGNIIDRTKHIKDDEDMSRIKETITTATFDALKEENENVVELANLIRSKLQKIEGFEEVSIYFEGNDYVILVEEYDKLTFEEATGKRLQLYIDSYVTRDAVKGR